MLSVCKGLLVATSGMSSKLSARNGLWVQTRRVSSMAPAQSQRWLWYAAAVHIAKRAGGQRPQRQTCRQDNVRNGRHPGGTPRRKQHNSTKRSPTQGCRATAAVGRDTQHASRPSRPRCHVSVVTHSMHCRATCALFRALCESVLLSCSESVLLSCSNSPSWPSRSSCHVSVVAHSMPADRASLLHLECASRCRAVMVHVPNTHAETTHFQGERGTTALKLCSGERTGVRRAADHAFTVSNTHAEMTYSSREQKQHWPEERSDVRRAADHAFTASNAHAETAHFARERKQNTARGSAPTSAAPQIMPSSPRSLHCSMALHSPPSVSQHATPSVPQPAGSGLASVCCNRATASQPARQDIPCFVRQQGHGICSQLRKSWQRRR